MSARPLDDRTFATLIEHLGPFERRPKLAVAVSGGSDSLALTLLAARWAKTRRGSVVGLTVDHGLRPESAAEAAQVGGWLRTHGIKHKVLRWTSAKPEHGIQAAARAARYGLLIEQCRRSGILHLLLAHHRDDQAETVLMRQMAGSGPDGLAAMAPVAASESVRLLRPLLGQPKTRLEATLRTLGLDWIDDPSNRNEAYQRVRLRRQMAADAKGDLVRRSRKATASRIRQDMAAGRLLAGAVTLRPQGYALIEPARFLATADETGTRALGRVIRTVSGAAYGPAAQPMQSLWNGLKGGLKSTRSLGGCLLMPWRGTILVMREPAAMAKPILCAKGGSALWDGRYSVTGTVGAVATLGPLGKAGWTAVRDEIEATIIPAAVIPTLPALRDGAGRLAEVPHLGWGNRGHKGSVKTLVAFTPASPLTGGLVWHQASIMC